MEIFKIVNNPISSNCYILYKFNVGKCIIVDPGSENNDKVISFLRANDLTPDYIFLTHEHFDHVWGLNELRIIYQNVKVVSSHKCSQGIICSKKNMSAFYKNYNFKCTNSDIIFDSNFELEWLGIKFNFISTEGHSPGSICIYFGKYLISGDTIIWNEKTVTKFPNGSLEKLLKSITNISEVISFPINILPGHGIEFKLNSRLSFLNEYHNN